MSAGDAGAIRSLTGLRGWSAVWVLLYHVQVLAPAMHAGWPNDIPLLDRGWAAVDLFFILSGFLLMRAHEQEMARPTREALLRFACQRLARVYPLNLAVTGLVALLLAADPAFRAWFRGWDPGHLAPVNYVATAALATRWFLPTPGSVNPPVWSLSVEMLGYAAFPLLAWAASRRLPAAGLAVLAAAPLALLAAVQIAEHHVGVNDIGQTGSVLRMATCFCSGVLLWRLRRRASAAWAPAAWAPAAWAPEAWAAPAAAVAVLAVALASLAPMGTLLLPGCFAVLILALSFDRGVVSQALSSAPSLFLGRISFPLYLCHLAPLLCLMTTPPRSGWQAAVALGSMIVLVIVLATMLHVLVERPMQRLGSKRFFFEKKNQKTFAR